MSIFIGFATYSPCLFLTMNTTHPVYMELYFQMRQREDLRSQEEIMLIALREWMEER